MMDSPIRNMIDNILSNKESEALVNFETAVADKLTDSLDMKKQEIAASLGQEQMHDFEEETVGEAYNPVTVKKGTRRNVDSGGKVTYSGGVRVKGKGASSAGKLIGHDIDVQKRKESMFKQKHPVLSKIKSAGSAVSKAIDKVASIKVANKNRAGG
jgi:hypothetical protein